MTEAEFETLYRQTLLNIEESIEGAIENDDSDIDYETINDILTLEFEDGSAIIITKQSATHQLWLAAVSGGFHFEYNQDTSQWQSTINQETLSNKLTETTSQQSKEKITFPNV